jgi:CheY-like chemotaxis protein
MFEIISGSIHLSEEFRRSPSELSLNGETFTRSEAKRPRILVVDDEKLIVDTIAEILQNAGFHVAAAYDGWTALEAARLFHPDYLLSDVLMPKMNGVELAIAIQKMHPAAKIVLFSGQAGISDILQSGHQRGLQFELIAKPIHPLKLIQRLKDQD